MFKSASKVFAFIILFIGSAYSFMNPEYGVTVLPATFLSVTGLVTVKTGSVAYEKTHPK